MNFAQALSYSADHHDEAVPDASPAEGPGWTPLAHVTASSATAPRPLRRYVVGQLEIDVDRHRVIVLGRRVHLSAMQMRLLVYLVEHLDIVVSRSDLLQDVWGYKPTVRTRTVDIHVQRLRGKLGTAAPLIGTVRGVGYCLSVDRE